MSEINNENIIKGLLYLKGEEGINFNLLAKVLDISLEDAKAILENYYQNFNDEVFKIDKVNENYKLLTKEEYFSFFSKIEDTKNNYLSNSAIEVLTIILYNQPINKARIDYIRGVNSSPILKKLLVLEYIKIESNDSSTGANLYTYTDKALDYFGLSSINDLKEIKDINISEIDDKEIDLYLSKYQEGKDENK